MKDSLVSFQVSHKALVILYVPYNMVSEKGLILRKKANKGNITDASTTNVRQEVGKKNLMENKA